MKLKIGTMLILEPTYTERLEKLRCKVVEQEDGVLFIDYPVNTSTKKTAFVIDGAQFRASFLTEQKQNYVFTTEVLGRQAGTVPMIKLSCPPEEEFIKIQRREYVRVNTPADVSVEFKGQFSQFVTEDLSAGGILLKLEGTPQFQLDDVVKLILVLPYKNKDIHYVHTTGTVVGIFEKDEKRYASIQFLDTDDLDKQYIVRFCFERQLEMRKKELNDL